MAVEIFQAPTHRDYRCSGLGDHLGHGGADAATRGAGNYDHATFKTEQVIDHYGFLSGQDSMMRIIENMILCKWPSVKWCRFSHFYLLSGPDTVANVTG
jgi:hypothetical protein